VPAGATHIGSTVDTTSSKGAPLQTVAFTNPDRSTVLVALNTGTTTQAFTVVYGTHSFAATVPAGGTVTYQWAQIH
jgi:glucosylceramidase